MTLRLTLAALLLAAIGTTAIAAPGTIGAMKWQRRVILVSSAKPSDPEIAVQRRILQEWQQGAADRDISLVTVTGAGVDGATDSATALRKRYRLDGTAFQALLIGKDGHVAMRSSQPIETGMLQGTIDAMPMRRNGER